MSDMMTMAGALSPQQMQMQQGAMGGSPPNTNGAPQQTGMGGQEVTGNDKQAMFETVVTPLVDYVQGDGRAEVVKVLSSTPDVGRNAGSVISKMMLAQMQNAQQQAGRHIPAEIVGQSSLQMSNLLTDIAIEEQLVSEEMADDVADDAFYNSLADIGEGAPEGLLTPEDMQMFQQMISELEQSESQRDSGGDSGGMGMNAGVGNGMGASNMSMAAQTAPGAPTETASAMNAGMYDGNPNGGSLNG